MNEIPGLMEEFKKARIVFLTTYNDDGEEHNRKMTNLNDNPYSSMWFPTYTNTRKVREVAKNSKALITFPAEKRGEFYEIEGKADVETGDKVEKKWFWWYLYWRPSQKNRFWFPGKDKHPEWAIINFHPISVKLLNKISKK